LRIGAHGKYVGCLSYGGPGALFSVFGNPGKFYGADPYTFLFAAVLILIFGPGWIALDTLIARQYPAQTPEQGRPLHRSQTGPA